MSVQADFDEDEYQLVLRVSCKDIASTGEIENTFNDLDAALNKIEESLDNPDVWFFLIVIEAKGAPSGPGEFDPYDQGGQPHARNPWEVFCPPFWTRAVAIPHLRQRVKNWLARLEKALQLAATLSRSTDSLWEIDETQLGEPLATHLALLDVEFVPYYTRLLRLWDMAHEVEAGGAIVEIVKKHGIRAETEELILAYAEWDPDDELGLREALQKAKGR